MLSGSKLSSKSIKLFSLLTICVVAPQSTKNVSFNGNWKLLSSILNEKECSYVKSYVFFALSFDFQQVLSMCVEDLQLLHLLQSLKHSVDL